MVPVGLCNSILLHISKKAGIILSLMLFLSLLVVAYFITFGILFGSAYAVRLWVTPLPATFDNPILQSDLDNPASSTCCKLPPTCPHNRGSFPICPLPFFSILGIACPI